MKKVTSQLLAASKPLLLSLVLLQILFVILIFAASLISQDSQINSLREGLAKGQLSKNYPTSIGNTKLDGYTECLGLTTNLDGGRYSSFVDRVLSAPNVGGCKELKAWLAQTPLPETREHYYRYWHGEILVVPVFVAFGLTALHWAILGLLIITLGLAFRWLMLAANASVAFAAVAPLLMTTNFMFTPFTTTQGLSNVAILGSVPAIIWATKNFKFQGFIVASALAGSVFNFIDLLTTPGLGWALAVFAAVVAGFMFLQVRPLLLVAGSTIAWLFGYGATWFTRWLIAMFAWPPGEVVDDVLHQMFFRIDGANANVNKHFGSAVKDNLQYWIHHSQLAIPVLVILGLLLLVTFVSNFHTNQTGMTTFVALMLPAMIIPCWYELLSNHSQIHTFFTYRSISGAVGIVLASCIYVLSVKRTDSVNEV